MKKFYTLALGAIFAFSASAQVLTAEKANRCHEQQDNKVAKVINIEGLSHKTKAPAKIAASAADVAGNYKITYYVELVGMDGWYSQEMTVSEGTAASTVVLDIPYENSGYDFTLSLTGTVNALTGEITFKADQPSGVDDATISLEHWDGSNYVSVSSITATYTGTSIDFDEDDAIGLLTSDDNYYTFFDFITMTKIIDDPNADPNEGWTSLGNATFVDPWVIPGFGENPEDYPWEVELQQNDADKNVYRLVDPYAGSNCPVASLNSSTATHGYIQFNVEDPDHVYFDIVEAGFANPNLGITELYCYNSLGWAIAYFSFQYTPSYIVQALGDDLVYTTFKNGVVTLGSKEAEDGSVMYDACFGIQGNKVACYKWTDKEDNPLAMLGSITFPGAAGVDVIEAEDADAQVKYYNLQGVQVAEPVAGQLVIRVQGEKATKMVVR